jgi:hypothetical protein
MLVSLRKLFFETLMRIVLVPCKDDIDCVKSVIGNDAVFDKLLQKWPNYLSKRICRYVPGPDILTQKITSVYEF